MPSSIHTIRAAAIGDAPSFVDVPVAGWGAVRVQRLQPHVREKFADVSGSSTPEQLLDLVCASAVDDGGALLFANETDLALLKPEIVAVLSQAAIDLNGL
jgi:hypothetical protein